MNQRMLIFPLLFIVLSALLSCKKSSTTANNPDRLKLYIEDARNTPQNEIDSFTVTYDASNRLTGLHSTILSELYTYNSSKSYTFDLYTGGTLSIHEIFYINGSSLVDSTLQYDNSNDTTTEGYLYKGKLLIRKSTYNYAQSTGSQIYMQEDYTYDNNGNLLTDSSSDGYGNINTISSFSYTSKPFNNLVGAIYLPIQAKNLPSSQTQTDGFGNFIASVGYTYVFDGSGRLTQETDAANNGQSVIKTYVYY